MGSYTITATYSGDSNHNGGDSGTITQQVVASASTTTLTPAPSSPNPSVYGQAVNFTATVVPSVQGAGTPTGTVQFLADGTLFDTESLSGSGVVTSASINTLTVASHTITARVLGRHELCIQHGHSVAGRQLRECGYDDSIEPESVGVWTSGNVHGDDDRRQRAGSASHWSDSRRMSLGP